MSIRTWQAPAKRLGKWHAAIRPMALVVALGVVQVGCGSDDTADPSPELTKDAGAATGNKPGGGSNIPKTFVITCRNAAQKICSEYLGAQSADNDIKAAAAKSCAQVNDMIEMARCSTTDLAGSCRTFGDVDGANRWVQTFYYAPLTEAQVKTRCQGDEFVPPEK